MNVGKQRLHGFTLIEILMVVGVIGLMASMIVPSFVGIKDGTDLERAKCGATMISAAKDLYLREHGQAARVAWAAAATDADKFLLVRSYPGLSSSNTLTTYIPTGYTVNMGSLGEAVTLWKGSTAIPFN